MATYLVTGGAGFIGNHLCKALLKDDNYVICIDNLITGTRDNIKELLQNTNFTFIQHDVSNYIDIKEDIDYVLHFASPASPVDYHRFPIKTLKVGSLGTHNCLGLAKAKACKFILASTSEIYGDPEIHPQPESYWGSVNCVGPRGCYDESKRFAEAITMAYHKTHGMDTKIVRIFNTYGPYMRKDDGRVMPNFITQALNDAPLTVYGRGLQTRSFCYIDDLIDGIIKLADSNINQPINLGNPDEITMLDLAKKIIDITKSSSTIVHKDLPEDEPKRRCPDISKAKKLLSWRPKINLEEGLIKTILLKKGDQNGRTKRRTKLC